MTPEQIEKSERLFEEAIALPDDQVNAFLTRECAVDAEVRNEVERLLGVKSRMTAGFLEQPATGWMNPAQLTRGQRIQRYEIEERLGSGGMSVVYRALDTGIGRRVALKILMPVADATNATGRFLSEIRTLGALSLANVVQLYDFGDFQGMPYIVMECLEGKDLAKAIAERQCGDFTAKLNIARQIAAALRDVHAAKIVHRDVKPANIFLEPSGRVKLMDFGMAREDGPRGSHSSVLMGTPEYISPEQIGGEPASALSDIYSYGILLFELFSGSRPYRGHTAALLHQIVSAPLPLDQLERASVPKPLIALIRQAAEKDPRKRTSSFEAILRQLDAVKGNEATSQATPGVRVKIASALLAFGSMAAILIAVFFHSPVNESREPSPSTQAERSNAGSTKPAPTEATAVNTPETSAPTATPLSGQKSPTGNAQPTAAGVKRFLSFPARTKQPAPQLPPPPTVDVERKPVRIPEGIQQTSARVSAPPPAVVSSASAPRVESAPDVHAVHRKEILQLLEEYAGAWRRKDAKRIQTLFPGVRLRDLTLTFNNSRKIEYALRMEGQPVFSNSSPLTAEVRCVRTSKIEYPDRKDPQNVDAVVLRLQQTSAGWLILSLE